MKSILKALFVIIGTIIGAGFASGQEIWLFFNKYENLGIIGIIVACTITSVLIYKVFQIVQKQNIENYSQLLEKISPNKVLNQIINIIISLFLLISFYIMIAGMSAYFNQEFGFPIWICSVIMAILCYITLQKDIKGVMLVNNVLIPFLILFILYLGIKNLGFSMEHSQPLIENYKYGWLFSSILYASYNSIVLIPMLVELKPYINTKNKAKTLSVTCTIILAILGICIFCLLLRNIDKSKIELPMIEIAKSFGKVYQYLYGGVIVTAIYTSAISAGYSFLKNEIAKKKFIKGDIEKRTKKYYQKLLLTMCISAPLIANLGFSKLVSILYPIFGILGLIQIVLIFIRPIEKNTKNWYK